MGIGQVGVKYKGDVMNRFNVLSKKGRRRLRDVVGRKVVEGQNGVGVVVC